MSNAEHVNEDVELSNLKSDTVVIYMQLSREERRAYRRRDSVGKDVTRISDEN